MQGNITIIPIPIAKNVEEKDDLAQLLVDSFAKNYITPQEHDVIVITQKIVSKAEGRIIDLTTITPSVFAQQIAKKYKKDPRYVEVVLQETKRIVRMDHGIIISETHHGFICANAGVDASNVGKKNAAALLPKDPDASAKALSETLYKKYKLPIGVIISDTWGRPWREGQVNFAIGSSGIEVLRDYVGQYDPHGYELKVSLIAVADELAAAAELVMGKIDNVPVALIRGFTVKNTSQTGKDLMRNSKKDLFR